MGIYMYLIFITTEFRYSNTLLFVAERLSARHPNSGSRSRFVMFVCTYVCQSRFRNSIIVTLRNSGSGGVGACVH